MMSVCLSVCVLVCLFALFANICLCLSARVSVCHCVYLWLRSCATCVRGCVCVLVFARACAFACFCICTCVCAYACVCLSAFPSESLSRSRFVYLLLRLFFARLRVATRAPSEPVTLLTTTEVNRAALQEDLDGEED